MPPVFVLKTRVDNPGAEAFAFKGCKTMYGGKAIGIGDQVHLFASETHGGRGLLAWGVVTSVAAPPRPGAGVRDTARVDLALRVLKRALRPLGRAELKGFRDWGDGGPETELNFKLYRQATDKIVGVTPATAAFLTTFFTG